MGRRYLWGVFFLRATFIFADCFGFFASLGPGAGFFAAVIGTRPFDVLYPE
jgi:hypothetical protein